MKGTVRAKPERGPNYWEMRVDAGRDPVTKRRRQVSRAFRGTRRDADRALRAFAAEVDAGKHAKTGGTVGYLLDAWVANSSSNWSLTHQERMEQIIRLHLRPALGAIPLSKLGAPDIDTMYRRLMVGGLKPATVRKAHNALRKALSQAVRWGWIGRNPADAATPPIVPSPQINPPAPEEAMAIVERLKSADRASWRRDPEAATFYHLAVATGARRGELCGIRRSDVDVDEATLLIRRSVVQAGTQVVEKSTKTHRHRRISLGPPIVALVVAQFERRATEADSGGVHLVPDPYLFPAPKCLDGSQPSKPSSWSQRYRRLADAAGLKGVRLHDSRHLHATRLLGAGMDVRTVAGRLGHARASTTLDIYGHFLPAADRKAAAMIDEILTPKHDEGAQA